MLSYISYFVYYIICIDYILYFMYYIPYIKYDSFSFALTDATMCSHMPGRRIFYTFPKSCSGTREPLNLHNSGYRATPELRIARIDVKFQALSF